MTSQTAARSGAIPDSRADLLSKQRDENFPVAMRILPGALRSDLVAVYDVVRTIDELGDAAEGDRTVQLTDFAADLSRLWSGDEPRQAVNQRLRNTVEARGLTQEPFQQLIQANLQDQLVSEYPTWNDLIAYCALSAVPIGRLVLELFGESSPTNRALSDEVCIGLQLVEHWQDVGEDHAAGRIYLPLDDLARFGVERDELAGTVTSDRLATLIRFETGRASELIEAGSALVGRLSGWARFAVSGYVAGGRATVDALRRADGRVLAGPPKPARPDIARHLLRSLSTRR